MKTRILYRFTAESTKAFKICLINNAWTQTQFAEMAKVSAAGLSTMLNGQREISAEVETAIREHFPGFAKCFLLPEEISAELKTSQAAG